MFRKKQFQRGMVKLNIKKDGILNRHFFDPNFDLDNSLALLLGTLGLDSINIADGPCFDFFKCLTGAERIRLRHSLEDYIVENQNVQVCVPKGCANKICSWLGILEETDV